jgi:hypothetical protein
MTELNDNTTLTIPIRNLLALIAVVAVSITGYFNLVERITFLEHDSELQRVEVDMNSEFRIKWPRGELGALPDDAEQNIRLDFIEAKIKELEQD